MLKPLKLIDESFDRDRTGSYDLSVTISMNGFSFAVLDTLRNTFIVLVSTPKSEQQDFEELFNQAMVDYPWLAGSFKHVYLSFFSPYFTPVPGKFFSEQKARQLFELVHPLPDGFELHFTPNCNHTDATLLFALPNSVANWWLKLHPKASFLHPIAPLLSTPAAGSNVLLSVDFNENDFLVALHDGMKFAGANAYTGRHPNDVIYYLLAFCKELGYDSRNVKVSITGHSPMLAELNMLDGYFDRVSSIAQYPKVMLFSYQLISHRSEYFSLFNLGASCE